MLLPVSFLSLNALACPMLQVAQLTLLASFTLLLPTWSSREICQSVQQVAHVSQLTFSGRGILNFTSLFGD